MSKKDDESLERQIGNLGGTEELNDEPSFIGKKIKVPGQREELDKDEESEMNAFLNHARSRSKIESVHEREDDEPATSINIIDGWNEIDRAELGERSKYYPADWRFFVRPATVEAIKNWSAIDEERFDTVNAVLNEIIKSCVSIKTASGNMAWNRINSWDRFWFILKVREYTFKNGEQEIRYEDDCDNCEEKLTFVLEPKSLYYETPDEDIMKYWNSEDRTWYINPRDFDVEHDIVKLYVPTLEKDQAILDWAIRETRTKKKQPKEVFLRFLPWLLPKAPKDEKALEHFIQECKIQYDSWDQDMFDFMDDVVRNIQISPSENLRQVCPHCGEEVISHVQFPSGQVKYLFKTQAKHKKFGSR